MRILFLFFIMLSFSSIYAQNKIELNIGPGYYLKNSENAMKIMGEENFNSYFLYGFAYQRDNIWGMNLRVEYNYHRLINKNVISFYSYSHGVESSGSGDLSFVNHNIDLNYVGKINKYFFYGFGPSFVITNRIIEIKRILPINWPRDLLYDKLASSGLGANGYFSFQIPFTVAEKDFYFTSKLKLRYTYSIWFDEGMRKLDNYYQEFFETEFLIGLGYSF